MIQDVERILNVTELGNSETGDPKSMVSQWRSRRCAVEKLY